jgi:hypothetical protein
MRKTLLTIPLAVALAACATLNDPVEPGYSGPTVIVKDLLLPLGSTRAQFFVIEEVDGKRIHNALIESHRASNGRGFTLVGRDISRELPLRPLRIKLLATEETGAPIEAIFRAASGSAAPSVERVVDFFPQEGHEYVVTGEMSKQRSAVWILDLTTYQPASESPVPVESGEGKVGSHSEAAQRPRSSRTQCDKWGNPKDEHGNPCR